MGTARHTRGAYYYYYYYYTRLTASFPGQPGYQNGKTSVDLNENEASDDEVLGCSGISWTICKQSAPCSRQITTPTPHHSSKETFYRLDALPNAQPTVWKH